MSSSLQAAEELPVSARGRAPATGLQLEGRPLRAERLIEFGLFGCAFATVLTTVGIVATLAMEALGFLREVPLSALLLDTAWTPLFVEKHFGIWPLVAGTLLTSAIALGFAVPLGLLAAIYLAEFAHWRTRRILKPALEVLAGIPSIVFGYFALVVLTPLLQEVVPGLAGFNALSPGIVIGLMVIPMIASLSEDAIRAVPGGLREAAFGLGASKLATIFRIVLPSASGGIAASAILALSRAVGETMVVAIAAGQQARLTLDPRVPIETMTAYIVQISMGDTPTGTIEYRTIFVVGAALFLMTLMMNVISHRLTRKRGAA
ncbi:MAG: phosphate ABC transporter permease subunit PstC [Myxococcales bacterium]|nr:phosphate ABC transporter permease subunit PstC [Myxococcales bacterium]MDD9964659.1 phosphate ABC transporter permease subunit PstC [Myxococcales bacterium]